MVAGSNLVWRTMQIPVYIKVTERELPWYLNSKQFPVSIRHKQLEIGLTFWKKSEMHEFIRLVSREYSNGVEAIKSLHAAKVKCNGRHDYTSTEFFNSLIENC